MSGYVNVNHDDLACKLGKTLPAQRLVAGDSRSAIIKEDPVLLRAASYVPGESTLA